MKMIDQLILGGMTNKLFTNEDLKRLLMGSPASRYALINKALKKGEIVQLRRGIYVMGQKYAQGPFSQFNIASQMISHSYVSLESALSFHGWIPEKVTVISSIIHHGRTKTFKTPLGEFQYYFIPVNEYEFLTGVIRVKEQQQPFFIASPLRALMDLVYEKKLHWQGLTFLLESHRIEEEYLFALKKSDFDAIKRVYRSKRLLTFLQQLEVSLLDHE
jgi:hypothetical protein